MVMARSFRVHGSVCLIPMIPRGGGPSPYRTRETPPNTPRITFPIEGNQNAEQIILAMARLVRETENEKIAVVLDNAGFHHAKAVTDLYEPGQALERIKPIYLPPYAPDHNPTEHVWNAAKDHIANIQHDTPEQTWTAFTSYITSRIFDYDFEHLPTRTHPNDLVS